MKLNPESTCQVVILPCTIVHRSPVTFVLKNKLCFDLDSKRVGSSIF